MKTKYELKKVEIKIPKGADEIALDKKVRRWADKKVYGITWSVHAGLVTVEFGCIPGDERRPKRIFSFGRCPQSNRGALGRRNRSKSTAYRYRRKIFIGKPHEKITPELKREAREAATSRGHDLMHFAKLSARLHVATCSRCKRMVQINGAPTANEIDIGGELLMVDCDYSFD